MNTTSSHLPICVYCGTPRPADETLCPNCGKPWIDTTIDAAPPAASPVVPDPTPTEPTTEAETENVEPSAGIAAAAAEDDQDDSEEQDDESGVAGGAVVAGTAAVAGAAAVAAREDERDDSDDSEEQDDQDDSEEQDEQDGASGVAGGAVVVGTAAVAGAAAVAAHAADDSTAEVTGDSLPTVPPPPPFDPDDTGEFAFDDWSGPPEELEEPRRLGWIVPVGLGVVLLAVVGYLVFGGSSTSPTTTIAAVSTTVASGSTTTTSSTETTTTVQTTTTVAVPVPQPGDWPAVGDPIPTDELTLKASSIGPINFGTPISEAAGKLTASFGEGTAAGTDGLCPPEEGYWLQFGQFTAIFDGYDDAATFVSYRYDQAEDGETDIGLKTLSGIAIGDTVEDLINTYTQFTISFEVIDSKDHFRLSDGGDLLLWGPVSSSDPAGLIEGIYAPSACNTSS